MKKIRARTQINPRYLPLKGPLCRCRGRFTKSVHYNCRITEIIEFLVMSGYVTGLISNNSQTFSIKMEMQLPRMDETIVLTIADFAFPASNILKNRRRLKFVN